MAMSQFSPSHAVAEGFFPRVRAVSPSFVLVDDAGAEDWHEDWASLAQLDRELERATQKKGSSGE